MSLELSHSEEDSWSSLSDLMAGLMMVFLLIALVFMVNVENQRRQMKQVAVLYDHVRKQLFEELKMEFSSDLPIWGAEISEDLAISFQRESLMFANGSNELNVEFEQILQNFFPRYLSILSKDDFKSHIDEIRIEGHTSKAWGDRGDDEAYILNMGLSQARTKTTLAYVLNLDSVSSQKTWLIGKLTANGLSSSKPIFNALNEIDETRSRRVEFKVRTDAEFAIATLLETLK
ncbi:MAG: OmpA family protein [Saccharospirillaceae bacterium]|nr:OmpA family protein [Pseudomonadales bacterium]NRB78214.1 OmpA family protein [Saccharospirillaceae bacterium]